MGTTPAAPYCTLDGSSCNLQFGLQPAAIDQNFGDLHRIQRRTFAQIVGHDPKVEAVVDRRILADAGDIGRVLARSLVRGDVTAGLAPVDDQTAGRLAQDLARFVGADWLDELEIDRFRMADEHRDTDTGR